MSSRKGGNENKLLYRRRTTEVTTLLNDVSSDTQFSWNTSTLMRFMRSQVDATQYIPNASMMS
uniref:Uncharacterized protein n=1 Tax=Cnaphalocrocis medinalis granulovirus TaxID=1750712 RepID=A0A109WW64_9BBAC